MSRIAFKLFGDGPRDFFMLGEEYLAPLGKSTPGSRRVTPSKTLPTEVRTPNSRRNRQFGGSIPRISAHTVHRVLTSEIQCNYLLVDCRYPYEYEGGHIMGAINCPPSEKLVMMDWLFNPEHGITRRGPLIIVMHCEFSQCRAPRMATDVFRQYINLGLHTGLEVYVMKGGYSDFYRYYPQWCDPVGYIPMHDHRNEGNCTEFDPDMFVERSSLSSQKDGRSSRRFRAGLSIGAGPASLPSDSPFFQASCSMDYSPIGVVADLARVFEDHHPPNDDSSSGGSAVSRRGAVYINTDDDSGGDALDDEDYNPEENDIGLGKLEDGQSIRFIPSESPSRASSSTSIFSRTSFPHHYAS